MRSKIQLVAAKTEDSLVANNYSRKGAGMKEACWGNKQSRQRPCGARACKDLGCSGWKLKAGTEVQEHTS